MKRWIVFAMALAFTLIGFLFLDATLDLWQFGEGPVDWALAVVATAVVVACLTGALGLTAWAAFTDHVNPWLERWTKKLGKR